MAIRDKCPGQKECDDAIDSLNSTITQLDQAILAAMSQQLQPHASSTLQVTLCRGEERERQMTVCMGGSVFYFCVCATICH